MKTRVVENGVNSSTGASDCGAGYYLEFFLPSSRIEHISISGQYSKIIGRFL